MCIGLTSSIVRGTSSASAILPALRSLVAELVARLSEVLFFSTMVEPSAVNTSREVQIAGSGDGMHWQVLARWKKDKLPMRYFQYGNAFLPDGENSTRYLAATTIAVETDDLVTTIVGSRIGMSRDRALALLSPHFPRLSWFRTQPVDVLA